MPIFRQDTKLLIDKGGLFSTIDISKVRDANSQYGIYTEAQHINREHFKLSVAKVRIIFETTWKNTKSLVFLISINMLGCYFFKKLTKKKTNYHFFLRQFYFIRTLFTLSSNRFTAYYLLKCRKCGKCTHITPPTYLASPLQYPHHASAYKYP